MPGDGRGQVSPARAIMSFYMLSLFGIAGEKERNRIKFRTLAQHSGFIVKQVRRLPKGYCIIFAASKE